jgi:hypothetical protein
MLAACGERSAARACCHAGSGVRVHWDSMLSSRSRSIAIGLICSLALLAVVMAQAPPLQHRWMFVDRKVNSEQGAEQLLAIVQTGAEHGINGIALNQGLDSDNNSPEFLRWLDRIKGFAKSRSMDIIPVVFSAGYGASVVHQNPNLAEGLPVKDALYVVHTGEARLVEDSPARVTAVNAETERFKQEIAVTPYRCYRLTLRVHTEDFGPARAFQVQVTGKDGRALGPSDPRIPATVESQTVTIGFNSAANGSVRIVAGAGPRHNGKLRMDDLRIEEIGLVNILRRPGTPLTVKSEAGKVYEEGKDFEHVADPSLNFRFDHDGPPIRVLPHSRIREGERLRVSYYHGIAINKGQVTVCMSEPEVYAIWAKQARRIQDRLAPRWWWLDMDEVRAGGTCEACRKRGMSMGQILGDCITRQRQIIKAVNPGARIAVWSDMLDPNHNGGQSTYYLVDGNFKGSWNYIPKDLTIACWYEKVREASLAHFSKLGFETIAAAYYDANDLENPKKWIESMRHTPGATGIVYTTWQNKYDLLPGFGDLLTGAKESK